jgi:hypothetical protein
MIFCFMSIYANVDVKPVKPVKPVKLKSYFIFSTCYATTETNTNTDTDESLHSLTRPC